MNTDTAPSSTGRLYGIGVGPGDPELLTLKAIRVMNECDVLAWPAPDSGRGLAYDIAAPHLHNPAQARIPLHLPILLDPFPAQQAYDDLATRLATWLTGGSSVGVLCEGDPLFYGSFMYLLERLSARFPVTVIPGVSSLMACAAAANWPLVSRNEPFQVLPGPLPDEVLLAALQRPGTYALMKVGRHFSRLRELLDELNLLSASCYIEHASRPDQRVLPLADVSPSEVPYFSMILVKHHA